MRKKLTREDYRKRFERLIYWEYNYVPQDGEIVVRCDEKYPEYWYLSNMGYLMSVSGNRIKILRPHFRTTGKKNKDGKRSGGDWYYRYGEKKISMHKIIAEHFLLNEFESLEDVEIHHIRKRNTFAKNQPQFCNRVDNLQILPKSIHRVASFLGKNTEDVISESWGTVDLNNEEEVNDFLTFLNTFAEQGVPIYGFQSNGSEDINEKTIEVHMIDHVEV